MAQTGLDLPGLADEIERIETLEGLWACMVRFFNGAGFSAVLYAVYSRGRPGEVSVLLMHGLRELHVRGFYDLEFGRNDANFRYALETGQPSLRSRITEVTTLSPAEKQHREARAKLGGSDTLALPLFGPHNYTGVVSLGRAEDSGLFGRLNWTQLQMAALGLHLKGLALQPGGAVAPHSLSEREVEILRWVAQGKSNGVIAEILSIASGTVDTYLRRIFDKLDVADRTSAAVKGVSMGLIQV